MHINPRRTFPGDSVKNIHKTSAIQTLTVFYSWIAFIYINYNSWNPNRALGSNSRGAVSSDPPSTYLGNMELESLRDDKRQLKYQSLHLP